MNNKGFAITGIIYTLFILFLMILVSVLSGIRIMQRSASDSVYKLKNKVEEVKEVVIEENFNWIKDDEILVLPNNEQGYYKYIFKVEGNYKDNEGNDVNLKINCTTYISHEVEVDKLVFSPSNCNEYTSIRDAIKSGAVKPKSIYKLKGLNGGD